MTSTEIETKYLHLMGYMINFANHGAMCAAYDAWDDAFARKEIRRSWTGAQTFRVTIAELRAMSPTQLSFLGLRKWADDLWLIPLWMVKRLADGEVLTAIDGEQLVVGADNIDLDVRFGCIAAGFHLTFTATPN